MFEMLIENFGHNIKYNQDFVSTYPREWESNVSKLLYTGWNLNSS